MNKSHYICIGAVALAIYFAYKYNASTGQWY